MNYMSGPDFLPRSGNEPGEFDPNASLLVKPSAWMTSQDQCISASIVIQHIEARRRRTDCFEPGMFADPAWDLLLWLYVAYLDQHRVTITQLTDQADVRSSTALRWIARLHDQNWVARTDDPTDNRRVFIGLSFKGVVAFNGYFTTCGYAPSHL